MFEATAKIENLRRTRHASTSQTGQALCDPSPYSGAQSNVVVLSTESPKPLKIIRRRKSERAVVFVTSAKAIPQAMLIGVAEEKDQED